MKPVRPDLRRARRACTLTGAGLAAALLLGGCALPKWSMPEMPRLALPEPWVKPYERERLADPVLQFQRDALSAKHFEHVREVREGSRGGTGVQGGGCGCN
jgi:hypothetical protein